MVGIPKSNRCSFCKLRKTKCDENWPQCSACKRAKRECSGPPNFKFVINGCHSTSATHKHVPSRDSREDAISSSSLSSSSRSHSSTPESSCGATIIDIKERKVQHGYSYHRMRLSKVKKPAPPPTAPADRLAAELVYCLNSAVGTPTDLRMWGNSLPMLPPRLSESVTLRHAAEVAISAWSRLQRGLPLNEWLDLRLYNRALRSMQQALEAAAEDPVGHLTTATLAAQTLLQKVEDVYDYTTGANQENHSAGLIAVISAGGPHQELTDLGLHLIFESFFTMLREDVKVGRNSVFADEAWATSLKAKIDSIEMQPPIFHHVYHFWVEMAQWPTLVRLLRRLHQRPDDTMLAAELILRATAVAEYLHDVDTTVFGKAMSTGDITIAQNYLCPEIIPTYYEYSSYELAHFVGTHAFFAVAVGRILQKANSFLGHVDDSIEHVIREYSQRMWMVYCYMRIRKPLGLGGVPHLGISYEAGDLVERAFVLAALEEVDPSRELDGSRRWVDSSAMAMGMAYTGRLPFIKTQDWSVEVRGLGCRC